MSAKLKYDAPVLKTSADTKPKKSNIKVAPIKTKKVKVPKMMTKRK